MEPELRKTSIRFYEIDLLRFIAALSVVIYHYTYRGYAAGHYSPIPFTELGQYTRYGYLGVNLFFLISGYVVLLSAQGKTVNQFFISRATRLYPAFWAACTLTFIVERIWGAATAALHMPEQLHATIGQYIFNMTMFYGFLDVAAIDSAYWSLTIEILFYTLISILMAYGLLRHINSFLALWLVYIALPLVRLSSGGILLPDLFFPDYAPYFVAGMVFFLLQQQGRTWVRYGLLIGSYLLSLRAGIVEMHKLENTFQVALSPLVVLTANTIFFGLFALVISRLINFSRFTWLANLGALTYPLYLIHSNIGYIIFHRLGAVANKYVLLSGTLALMLAAAYIIHIFIEKPFSKVLGQQLKKRLLPTKKEVELTLPYPTHPYPTQFYPTLRTSSTTKTSSANSKAGM
jgi:peptidoglycan/LPS O-acetylase OafA/YrhL